MLVRDGGSPMNDMTPVGINRKAAGLRVAERLRATTKIIASRIMTDPLMTYAYAGDASQYRLAPMVVVIVNSEAEVLAVLTAARADGLPVTFRAAGTSLSGQSNSDGVLCVLGDGFKQMRVEGGGGRGARGPAGGGAGAGRGRGPFGR